MDGSVGDRIGRDLDDRAVTRKRGIESGERAAIGESHLADVILKQTAVGGDCGSK